MKNIHRCIILLLSCFFIACGAMTESKLGLLSIKFNSDYATTMEARAFPGEAVRSLTPAEPWHATKFSIQGSGPDGATLSVESDEGGAVAKIVPGSWSITVHAYTASDKETGSGSCDVVLKPSQTSQATIQILPLAGTGNLTLTLEKNMAVPAGSLLNGELTHLGLPGRPEEGIAEAIAINISADQPSVLFENIPAGHYSLVLSLKDDAGTIVGGVAETMLVMKDFLTTGTCRFVMGTPELDLVTEIVPTEPLDTPLMSVSHWVPEGAPLQPLAIPSINAPDTITQNFWYLNGENLGPSATMVSNYGFLPENTMAAPLSATPYGVSLGRLDYVEQSNSGLSGSSYVLLEAHDGPMAAPVPWRASYDYTSALGPSLLGSSYPRNIGTQARESVRAVAASQAGLIVVAGMDEASAIHVFATGYGAEVRLPDTDTVNLSIDTSWVRMWRDEIIVDGSSRSADRLAISADGRFIAAANSSSNWIYFYALDAEGGISGRFSYKAELSDLEFSNIRDIDFSLDGTRLYALSNGRDGVFGFDVGASGIVRRDKVIFDETGTLNLNMQELLVTSSGAIVTSAKDTSTLYVLNDSGSLLLSDTITYEEGVSGGEHPSSLALRNTGDSFYTLCDSSKLVVFSRPDALSDYQIAGELILDAYMTGATLISSGSSPIGSNEMLCIFGGIKLGFIIPNADLTSYMKYFVTPDSGNEAGISTGEDLVYLDGAFILAGGSSGIASVFGRD